MTAPIGKFKAWTAGSTRTTGDVILASQWNAYLGAGGNMDHLFDGTKIKADLVYEASLASSNAPREGARLVYRGASTGGFRWEQMIDDPTYWIGR